MELGVIQHARPGPVPEEGCPIIVSLLFSNGFRFGGVFVNILGAYEFYCRLDSMTEICAVIRAPQAWHRGLILGNRVERSAVKTLKVQKGPWVQQRPCEYRRPGKGTCEIPMAWTGDFWQQ